MLKLLLADWLHADVAAIPIREEVFIKELNKAETDEWDQENEQALHIVASLDGNAIGTARLTPDGTIGHMAVLKSYRNQGVGSAMLERLIQVAKKSKFKSLKLNTPRSVEGFYIRHGFTVQGGEVIEAGSLHIELHLEL